MRNNRNKRYELSEQEKERITNLANELKLKPKWINDTLYLESSALDSWYCDLIDRNEIILYHKNKMGNQFENHFHKQRKKPFRDYDYILKNVITTHDQFKINKKYSNQRISNLYSLIESNEKKYIKLA